MSEDTQAKDNFERVADLFARARRVPPSRREAYLDVECGDDDALRTEVEALLAAHVEEPVTPIALVPGVAGFRILRRIGVGGMGTVYEAEQEHPHRRVALKALRLDALSPESLARFETEARALARLQHPGIARIFQAGCFEGPAGDMPYLVMELIEGPPVTEFAEGLGRDERIELLIQVCAAVEHAHQRGILHRDLKPANILVAADGRPRVLDFGVAREIEEPSPHTRTGHLLGTLGYMSPEQARGEFEDLDTRCDIYALGVIGYELVSGRLPHDVREKPLLEAARVVAEQPHASLGRDDLAIVLDKALAKDRERRYPSASAFADDLRRVLEREPVRARRPSRLYHIVRFAQRNRAIVATIAIALVGLLIALFQAMDAARFARTQEAVADRARYAAQLQSATAQLDLGEVEEARALLERTEPGQRGWMWDHLDAVIDSDLDAWELPGPATLVHSFDPARPLFWSDGAVHDTNGRLPYGFARGGETPFLAGDVLVTADQRGHAYVLQENAPARELFSVRGQVLDVRVDRARDRALVNVVLRSGGSRLTLFDTKTRRPLWTKKVTHLKNARLTADGLRIVGSTHWNGELAMWNAADGTLIRRWTGHTDHITILAEAPATGMIATFAMDWHIRIWDKDGAPVAEIDDPGQWVYALAFSPDGRRLASGHPGGAVRFWDARTGAFVWAAAGDSDAEVQSLAWAGPDRLYCASGDGAYLRLARSSLARDVLAHHDDDNKWPYVYDAAFSPDGRRVASIGWDGTARIAEVATGRLLKTFEIPDYAEACGFAGPDLLVVACQGDSGTLVLDVTKGKRVAARALSASALDVHPDGTQVALARHWLYRVDPRTLKDVRPPLEGYPGVACCAYSPDGKRIVCGTGDGHVLIVEGDHVVKKWKAHDAWILSVAWSPTGDRVVVGTQTGHVSIFDAATGARRDAFRMPHTRVFSLAHSPDGRLLFVGSDEHAIRVWDMVGGNGLGRLRGHRGYVKGLAFSPDGNVLASASGDNTLRLWHRRTERDRR